MLKREDFVQQNDVDDEEEELYEHYRITADKGQGITRIDHFLKTRLERTSRNRIQNAAKAGCILVNGKPVKQNYKIKPLDEISIVMARPPRENTLTAENIPLNILFEDDDLIVLNKEAGMVVHPGVGNHSGTLVNALIYHFKNLPQPKKGLNPEFDPERPGLVHRIDKNTSGILVIAKTETAMSNLALQFFERTINRRYVALVWGNVENDEGTIEGNIGRDERYRKLMTVYADGSAGKHAVTHYKVLERFGYVTLVECKLETGRTHQIRVHMKYIGHTLFNDDRYEGNKILKGPKHTKYKQFVENCFNLIPGQALHAKTLEFTHPENLKRLSFDSDLPEGFNVLLEKWRNYSKAKDLNNIDL
jgi:23S rRNA pseudouridine1911/1915/1917 synthase